MFYDTLHSGQLPDPDLGDFYSHYSSQLIGLSVKEIFEIIPWAPAKVVGAVTGAIFADKVEEKISNIRNTPYASEGLSKRGTFSK
ncbi:MAG: hypothetical protein AB1454_13060 [Candidatus Auribacterota bacterium]